MVSPVHGDYRRCQAEIPLIVLSRFPGPALSINCHQKLSIGRQRKRKKMMPRGRPKGEMRPAEVIGMAGADLFA
jgi:hypothetical protein